MISQKLREAQTLREFIDVDIPHLNFFQYPPPAVSSEIIAAAPAILSLDAGFTNTDSFTMFISVPFCRVRCHSCPYFKEFLPVHENPLVFLDAYTADLTKQLQFFGRRPHFAGRRCGAIYLGGGTASLLAPSHIATILEAIREMFTLVTDCEITLEGNPREFTEDYLSACRMAGVNRVSLGYQSADESTLRQTLNSPHTANEGLTAVGAALKTRFRTVNVDLLYRMPGQTFDAWKADLDVIITLQPQGITCYEYVIHSASNSERLLASGRLRPPVSGDEAHQWYLWTRECLSQSGYHEHRKGSFSIDRHEQIYGALSYDQGMEILGIGAGSYGFINRRQIRTISDTKVYADRLSSGDMLVLEAISAAAEGNLARRRFAILNLMSMHINGALFHERFGVSLVDAFPLEAKLLRRLGLATLDQDGLILSDLGVRWRSRVMAAFYEE